MTYVPVTDREALDAFQLCSLKEGIIPALESSHALAALESRAQAMRADEIIVVNVSGRGDKDIYTVANALGASL